jgi:hypothetical protein
MTTFQAEINAFLETEEADLGLESRRSLELVREAVECSDINRRFFSKSYPACFCMSTAAGS